MKTYYMLTKPGIIMGNIVTMTAGYALASRGNFNILLFIATLLGLGCVIASAGAFNSYLDRAADAKMARTKDRPLVTGAITPENAIIFGSILGVVGMIILMVFTNFLTAFVAFTGFFVYLVLYAIWKYRSFYGTLVGSVAGAVPPVVGYCAVSNRFDMGAVLLFLILLLWQMPHFFAIAIYRLKEYSAASIPVLPVQKGIYITKVQILFYIVAFMLATALLSYLGYASSTYTLIATLLGLSWLALGFLGFRNKNDILWAKQMFAYSLVVIMTLCITITVDSSFL